MNPRRRKNEIKLSAVWYRMPDGLASLISIFLHKFFQLDFALAVTTAGAIASLTETNLLQLSLFALFGLGWYLHHHRILRPEWLRPFARSHTVINLYREGDISKFVDYMRSNPTFFGSHGIDFGRPESHNGMMIFTCPLINQPISYNDPQWNISGTVVTCYTSVESLIYLEGTKKSVSQIAHKRVPYMSITITSGAITALEFHQKLLDWHQASHNYCRYYCKIIADYSEIITHYVSIVRGIKPNERDMYDKYIRSFINPQRDELWRYLHTVHHHPERLIEMGQAPCCNLLLYGPPGTGKSTFAYRVAMALGRHLISVDLTQLLCRPSTIYQILQNPEIRSTTEKCSQVVFVFEEFDITIDYMLEQEEKQKTKKHRPKKHEEKKKDDSDSDDEQNDPQDRRRFQLRDLLELFQGPVPMHGGIIIATTNHYDRIRKVLPALFRPGRLTPVKFDYLDFTGIQELSQFYFARPVRLNVARPNIPTSQLVEIAVQCRLDPNRGFNSFQLQLDELINAKFSGRKIRANSI